MSNATTIIIIASYFGLLYLISRISAKQSNASTFFIANRNAPWPLVAYGMIGVAISGITFISVPGQVLDMQFSYFQMVIGYSIGLALIAYILLPVFYHSGALSIYSVLHQRFGRRTQLTGTLLFQLAQLATASFKLFLMAHVLQLILFGRMNMPFWLTVLVTLGFIWLYTYRGGIRTVIFTDALQTTFLILAVLISIFSISKQLSLSLPAIYQEMREAGISRVFFWSPSDPRNFFKLVLTGILLTVMTNGLDQSVMQKHLTCRNLVSSRRNILTLAGILLLVNALFLILGGALQVFSGMEALPLPAQTDDLYPSLAVDHLGVITGAFFLLGIAAAAYSSADSSLTGLTTSFCVDILRFNENDQRTRLREWIHLGFTAMIFLIILVFRQINDQSVLSAFIRTAGLVYGPLLALYVFGIYSKRLVRDALIPWICLLSPFLTLMLERHSESWFGGYRFGYEILLLNSLIALGALLAVSRTRRDASS